MRRTRAPAPPPRCRRPPAARPSTATAGRRPWPATRRPVSRPPARGKARLRKGDVIVTKAAETQGSGQIDGLVSSSDLICSAAAALQVLQPAAVLWGEAEGHLSSAPSAWMSAARSPMWPPRPGQKTKEVNTVWTCCCCGQNKRPGAAQRAARAAFGRWRPGRGGKLQRMEGGGPFEWTDGPAARCIRR